MANIELREKACALRTRGESIKTIARMLDVSSSTVSHWCRNVVLTKSQIKALALRQKKAGMRGRLHAAELKRAARIARTKVYEKQGQEDVGSLNSRDLFILGMGLYWGEGYKSANEECALTNSDPDIIRSFILWLKRVYKVPPSDLILRVSINSTHSSRVSAVEKYWSELTHIPLSQFSRASLIHTRTKKRFADHESHMGTLRVKVRRATNLRRRIIGSLKEIRFRMR
jgi:hypothetical protein